MKLIRYHTSRQDPLRHSDLREDVGRLFDFAFPAFNRLAPFREATATFGATDLYRDGDNLILRSELPGFRKEDIAVEVKDNTLILTGHYRAPEKSDTEAKDGEARQEKHITRSFSLSPEVALDQIKAVYENGVLTVTLPKKEEAKPRSISIDTK